MGKTRDLCKEISDTRGTFHAKMSSIKDRNGMDLTEAEDSKKRWEEYTELYKKDLKVKITQLCLTLCDPMDYTVHGILQDRILKWVVFLFSRGSSQPRD